jgi:hypothetical protein
MQQPQARRPISAYNPFRERFERLTRFATDTAVLGNQTGGRLTGLICWTSAIDAAESSRAITHATAEELRGIANNPALGPYRLSEHLPSRQINSATDMDTIEPGCLLVFVSVSGQPSLSHVMVAIGQGEAVGSNNGALSPALSARWQRVRLNDFITWQGNTAVRGDGGRLEVYAVFLSGTDAPQCIVQ